jgi:hypothetical protein
MKMPFMLLSAWKSWMGSRAEGPQAELAGPVAMVREAGKSGGSGIGLQLLIASALSVYAMPALALAAFFLLPGRRKRAPR